MQEEDLFHIADSTVIIHNNRLLVPTLSMHNQKLQQFSKLVIVFTARTKIATSTTYLLRRGCNDFHGI